MINYANLMDAALAYCLGNPGVSIAISDEQLRRAGVTLPEWAIAHELSCVASGNGWKIKKEVTRA